MKIALFYHSLVSDWGHGVAHFLRGYSSELLARGHDVTVHEPEGSWSLSNLIRDQGLGPLEDFREAYPALASRARSLSPNAAELGEMLGSLEAGDLVIVHETTPRELVLKIGLHRRRNHYKLLYHDTHHRVLTCFEEAKRIDLSNYDGALCFGQVIADSYRFYGLAKKAWTWHEAADTRVFHTLPRQRKVDDLVWVGNWAEGERRHELREFFIEPVRKLGIGASSRGARFPADARGELEEAGIRHRGWIANFRVPELFSASRATVHIPRRPYAEALPGIPTIRVFEALACGIPLVCAPWQDTERLFTPGQDFLVARDGREMEEMLHAVLADPDLAERLSAHGLATLLARHTCAHRVDQLLAISHEET